MNWKSFWVADFLPDFERWAAPPALDDEVSHFWRILCGLILLLRGPLGFRVGRCRGRDFYSDGKMVIQSSFMLITVQWFFFASAMSESLKVPILESDP